MNKSCKDFANKMEKRTKAIIIPFILVSILTAKEGECSSSNLARKRKKDFALFSKKKPFNGLLEFNDSLSKSQDGIFVSSSIFSQKKFPKIGTNAQNSNSYECAKNIKQTFPKKPLNTNK